VAPLRHERRRYPSYVFANIEAGIQQLANMDPEGLHLVKADLGQIPDLTADVLDRRSSRGEPSRDV
jgi:hypothetical protein